MNKFSFLTLMIVAGVMAPLEVVAGNDNTIGQRMIVDERVPQDPVSDKPIFTKPIIVPSANADDVAAQAQSKDFVADEQSAQKAEEAAEEAHDAADDAAEAARDTEDRLEEIEDEIEDNDSRSYIDSDAEINISPRSDDTSTGDNLRRALEENEGAAENIDIEE